jgi:accessory gene regulator B
MISMSIEKITKYWVKNNIIHEDDCDIYEYGLDLLVFSLLNYMCIFLTAIVINRLIESVILFVIMIPLQSCGGGYHAKTHFRCFLIMYIGWWIMMWMIPHVNYMESTLISTSSVVLIFFLAPVPNANVPISELRRQKLKIMIRVIAVVAGIISILARPILVNQNVSGIVAMGMGGIALSMVAANIKNIV